MQWQEDKVLLKKTGQLVARTNGSPDSSIPGYLVTLLLKKFVILGAPRKCPTNVAQHYTNQSTNNPQIQCDQSSQAKVGGADPPKKFIGKNSKTP